MEIRWIAVRTKKYDQEEWDNFKLTCLMLETALYSPFTGVATESEKKEGPCLEDR